MAYTEQDQNSEMIKRLIRLLSKKNQNQEQDDLPLNTSIKKANLVDANSGETGVSSLGKMALGLVGGQPMGQVLQTAASDKVGQSRAAQDTNRIRNTNRPLEEGETPESRIIGDIYGNSRMSNTQQHLTAQPVTGRSLAEVQAETIPTTTTPEKKGALSNILSGAGDIAMTAIAGTRAGRGIMEYNQMKSNAKQQEFENNMVVYREMEMTNPESARKFMIEKILPITKTSPELVENYKQSQMQNSSARRKLPAEWDLMTPEDRQNYIQRYSTGGREYGAKPWALESITPTSPTMGADGQVDTTQQNKVKDVAEMSLGLKPKPTNPSATAQQELSNADYSRQAMKNLKSLYKSDYIGYPGKKELTKLRGYTSGLSGGIIEPVTKEQEAFMAATGTLKNYMIKLITGATVRAGEEKRIMSQVPSEADYETAWNAKYEQTLKNIDMLEKSQKDIMRKSNVDTSGFSEETKELSAKDKQALDWANNNPNDPRSQKIKNKLGIK